MRGLIEILTIFDWITPTWGYVQDFINDPTLLQSNTWTFFVPYNQALRSGWNAMDIQRLMKEWGIKTWGGQITNGEFFFSVGLDQARWGEYILNRHGIPLSETSVGAPARAATRHEEWQVLKIVFHYLIGTNNGRRVLGQSMKNVGSFFEENFL